MKLLLELMENWAKNSLPAYSGEYSEDDTLPKKHVATVAKKTPIVKSFSSAKSGLHTRLSNLSAASGVSYSLVKDVYESERNAANPRSPQEYSLIWTRVKRRLGL